METGLLHLHRTLGYLVFVLSLVGLVLALTKARTDARAARLMDQLHRFGLLMAGRLNILIGVATLAVGIWPWTTWWAWAGLLLWAPVEIVNKRMISPELALARDGGAASTRLVAGAAAELVLIVAIFGLMSARP
ncbi:hypothetical protein L6R53_06490 [Myxococcota bacterium]|nr:hypothetical protein [Myxococcota bacterium]